MAPRKLSKKQKDFALHYVLTLNATRAAELAGYSNKSNKNLRVQGHRNLQNANIRKEIQRLMREMSLSENEVVGHLSRIARGVDPTEFMRT